MKSFSRNIIIMALSAGLVCAFNSPSFAYDPGNQRLLNDCHLSVNLNGGVWDESHDQYSIMECQHWCEVYINDWIAFWFDEVQFRSQQGQTLIDADFYDIECDWGTLNLQSHEVEVPVYSPVRSGEETGDCCSPEFDHAA